MKLKYLVFSLVLLFFYSSNLEAQNNYTQIGKSIGQLHFDNVKYYSSTEKSLSEFKGKITILDFFTAGCASCFESMPKISKLRKKYKDKLEIMMIGLDDRNLQAVYDKYRKKWDLDIPVAFIPKKQWNLFDIIGVPHIIVLDKEGIVKTKIISFDEKLIESLLAGQSINVLEIQSSAERIKSAASYDHKKPFLINGNGGNDTSYLFRSLISKWDGKIIDRPFYTMINQNEMSGAKSRLDLIGVPLIHLYKLAYGDTLHPYPSLSPGIQASSYGSYWKHPLLQVRDSSQLDRSWLSKSNMYNYSLTVPPSHATTDRIQKIMQRDLENYFGYTATIETREMPCWYLRVRNKDVFKLRSGNRSKEQVMQERTPTERTDMAVLNAPIAELILYLSYNDQNGPPIIDETGIDYKIDIYIEGLTSDINDLNNGLKKNGLELVKGVKPMKVVIIRDL